MEEALKKAVEEAKAVKLEEERARGREVSRWRVLQAHNSHFMLSHCRPPPTVGDSEFFAGHPYWQTQPETVTVTNRRSSDYGRLGEKNLPHFAFVLRTVLTNAPNSCPPERLFSMFNATFGEDQQRSFGDYLELAMQFQYNKRNMSPWACVTVSYFPSSFG